MKVELSTQDERKCNLRCWECLIPFEFIKWQIWIIVAIFFAKKKNYEMLNKNLNYFNQFLLLFDLIIKLKTFLHFRFIFFFQEVNFVVISKFRFKTKSWCTLIAFIDEVAMCFCEMFSEVTFGGVRVGTKTALMGFLMGGKNVFSNFSSHKTRHVNYPG